MKRFDDARSRVNDAPSVSLFSGSPSASSLPQPRPGPRARRPRVLRQRRRSPFDRARRVADHANHRDGVGRVATRFRQPRRHAESLCASPEGRHVRGSPRDLSDLHDDERLVVRDRLVPEDVGLLRQHVLDAAAGERGAADSRRQVRGQHEPGLRRPGLHRGLRGADHARRLLRRPVAAGQESLQDRAGRRPEDDGARQVGRGLYPGPGSRRLLRRRERGAAAIARDRVAGRRLRAARQRGVRVREHVDVHRADVERDQRPDRTRRRAQLPVAQRPPRARRDRRHARGTGRRVEPVPARSLHQVHPAEEAARPDADLVPHAGQQRARVWSRLGQLSQGARIAGRAPRRTAGGAEGRRARHDDQPDRRLRSRAQQRVRTDPHVPAARHHPEHDRRVRRQQRGTRRASIRSPATRCRATCVRPTS